jgi:hypothetical protein|tara:strand:+ start:892 stop:1062 length:171 start_codon:yes stop_codon:yes gene_type:complete
MFPKSAILTPEQKKLVRHALFALQKEYYQKLGEIPPAKLILLDEIATALHLRDEYL